jgi:hypothetical protein
VRGRAASSMEGERRDWKGIAGAMESIARAVVDVGMRPLMAAMKARPPSGIGAERRMSGVGGRTVHYTSVDAYALLLRSSRDMRIEGDEAMSDGGVGARHAVAFQRCVSATCGEGEPHKARMTMHAGGWAALGMRGGSFRRGSWDTRMVYTIVLIVSRDYFYNYMPALMRRRLPPHLACSIPISPSLRTAAHHQHHSPDAAAATPHPCLVPRAAAASVRASSSPQPRCRW